MNLKQGLFEAGFILDFLLLWFNCRLFFNDPLVFAFYNVGEVLYKWTGVRFAEIKRNNLMFCVERSSCHQK